MHDRDDTLGPCPLCDRPMIRGRSVNQHHLIPRTFGGKRAFWIHKICHSKIHSLLSERELLKRYHTWPELRAHPEIDKFIRWVAKKEPEYNSPNHRSRERRRR